MKPLQGSQTRPAAIAAVIFVAVLIFLSLGAAQHAVERGLSMNRPLEIHTSRLHHSGAFWSNISIYGHMVSGGVLTVLTPLQLVPQIRAYVPRLHKSLGYTIAILALATATGGLYYMARNGTIGGLPMTLGFSAYGVLVGIAAVQTIRYARARHPRHGEWAFRLVVLALGSWIYRLHYSVWYSVTGGLYSRPDFSGAFDIAQTVLFYVPYLLALEIWLRLRRPKPVFQATINNQIVTLPTHKTE